MPTYLMDGRTEVYLTDDQIDLAKMALEDHPETATKLLYAEFGFTREQAVCAIAFVKKSPKRPHIQCRRNPRCYLPNGHDQVDPGGCSLRDLTGDSW